MKCVQEECVLWDGEHCNCVVFGIEPEEVLE